jgi:hypothetical protein
MGVYGTVLSGLVARNEKTAAETGDGFEFPGASGAPLNEPQKTPTTMAPRNASAVATAAIFTVEAISSRETKPMHASQNLR